MNDSSGWDSLLAILATGPRENGSPELARAAADLVAWAEAAGLQASLLAFVAYPWAFWIAGLVAFAGSLLYWRLMGDRRHGWALAVSIALPLLILTDLEGRPSFSRFHAVSQHHVAVSVEPQGEADQRILVTAHYDTKTDLLDHVARAPVEAAAAPVSVLMILAAVLALRGRVGLVVRATPWLAVASGLGFFATLSGGAFLKERSHGALDDGGSCAIALRLAEQAAASPLARTRLEVVLFSGEEVGTQGARAFLAEHFGAASGIPTAVLNLEGLGAYPGLAALAEERFTLRSHPADPGLLAQVDAIHQARQGAPLYVDGAGVTDAREFLARGIPAATLVSDPPDGGAIRGLHSAADDRSRIDVEALDEHLALLAAVLQRIDAQGL